MAAALGTTRAIGSPQTRVEGRAKVTGEARYAFEHPVEGVLYAAAVTSTIAAGRIAGIDTADALAVAGVVCVLSHENAPAVERAPGSRAIVPGDRQLLYYYQNRIESLGVEFGLGG